ncbi:MAG: helix-turn-helix domain-containing protein [Acidobacteriota bacterium]|nr:helix-turn-helix domain-containing protein [Acidobacteriota bacterium]
MKSSGQAETLDRALVHKTSTDAKPYHFVGSGLRNVYLVGVEYEIGAASGMQSAVIPCLPNLLEAIGKVLVEKRTPLGADEVRFLRKRLRFASKDFAELVGLSSEQYSRVENGAAKLMPTVERVVRLLYATLAKLPPSESEEVAKTKWTAELNREERIVACRDEKDGWVVLRQAA